MKLDAGSEQGHGLLPRNISAVQKVMPAHADVASKPEVSWLLEGPCNAQLIIAARVVNQLVCSPRSEVAVAKGTSS